MNAVVALACALAIAGCAKDTRTFQWQPPSAGPERGLVKSYNIKCGPTPGGPYPIVKVVTGTPLPTRYPVNRVLTRPGTYYCVVTASNAAGESSSTNETVVVVK